MSSVSFGFRFPFGFFFFKLFLKFIFISISKFRSLFPLVSPLKVSFLVFIDLASSFVAFLKIIFSKILNRFLLDWFRPWFSFSFLVFYFSYFLVDGMMSLTTPPVFFLSFFAFFFWKCWFHSNVIKLVFIFVGASLHWNRPSTLPLALRLEHLEKTLAKRKNFALVLEPLRPPRKNRHFFWFLFANIKKANRRWLSFKAILLKGIFDETITLLIK